MSNGPKSFRTPAAATTIADRLERVRTMHGYDDLKRFWRRVGQLREDDDFRVSYATVRNYHQGEREPSFAYIARITREFPNIRLAWLVLGEEPVTKNEEMAHEIFAERQLTLPLVPSPTAIQEMAQQIFEGVPPIAMPDLEGIMEGLQVPGLEAALAELSAEISKALEPLQGPGLERIGELLQQSPELEIATDAFQKVRESLEKVQSVLPLLEASVDSTDGDDDETTEPDGAKDDDEPRAPVQLSGKLVGESETRARLKVGSEAAADEKESVEDVSSDVSQYAATLNRLAGIFPPMHLATDATGMVYRLAHQIVRSDTYEKESEMSRASVNVLADLRIEALIDILEVIPDRLLLPLQDLSEIQVRAYINLICQAIEMLIPHPRRLGGIPVTEVTPEEFAALKKDWGREARARKREVARRFEGIAEDEESRAGGRQAAEADIGRPVEVIEVEHNSDDE